MRRRALQPGVIPRIARRTFDAAAPGIGMV